MAEIIHKKKKVHEKSMDGTNENLKPKSLIVKVTYFSGRAV